MRRRVRMMSKMMNRGRRIRRMRRIRVRMRRMRMTRMSRMRMRRKNCVDQWEWKKRISWGKTRDRRGDWLGGKWWGRRTREEEEDWVKKIWGSLGRRKLGRGRKRHEGREMIG